MVEIILVVGVAITIGLFILAAAQTSGHASRAEEEAERRRWKEMQRRGGSENE